MTILVAHDELDMAAMSQQPITIFSEGSATYASETELTVRYEDAFTSEEIYLRGSFGAYDSNNYPTTGTIEYISYTVDGWLVFELHQVNISVEEFRTFVESGDTAGLFATMFSGVDELYGSEGDDVLLGYAGDDLLAGWYGNDTLEGGGGHDVLYGNDGIDTLRGGSGDDYLVGGSANDVLEGGEGLDRVGYSFGATGGVIVDLNIQGVSQNTGQGADTLTGIEHVSGTRFNDVLTGDAGDNWIWGGSDGSGVTGDDVLSGGAGNDLIVVGAGNHSLDGGSGIDTASFYGNSTDIGPEGVALSLQLQGTSQDTRQGMSTLTGFENLSGSIYDDVLRGNGGNNVLAGDVGNDFLAGGAGNDTLLGDGRIGMDSHTWGGSGAIATVDNVFSLGGSGPADDTLDGGAGDDILNGGAGRNTASYASATGAVTVDLSSGSSAGAAGSDTLIAIHDLIGSGYDDQLTGSSGSNILDGGAGADVMSGGLGNDTYHVDNVGDRAVEGTNAGVDRVISTASFVLGANVEHLTLAGNAAINGTGNALANSISGNGANNVLDGAGGADYMFGNGGNDTYYVDNAGDRVIEGTNAGDDRVISTISYGLAANVEHLTLAGNAAINGTGNDRANSISGNGAGNVLNGGGGADYMFGGSGADQLYGGTGNDVLNGGAGADQFVFNTALDPAINFDRITDFWAADDSIVLDDDVFTAIGAIGTLSAAAFRTGTAAQDADDRIIYDSATGRIYYDADGNGAGAQILFAQVTAGLALTNADFLVTG